MEELCKHGAVGLAAIKVGMDRKTARKYIVAATLPSQMRVPRDWRTREDPFAEHREEVEALLRDPPELEAKTVFELLTTRHPDRFAPGQLRTLQRMIRAWRAGQGADKDVVLAQRHRPGEAAQTDFTSTDELTVTIVGAVFVHLLCVVMLPFSNWLWATVCLSESIARGPTADALRRSRADQARPRSPNRRNAPQLDVNSSRIAPSSTWHVMASRSNRSNVSC